MLICYRSITNFVFITGLSKPEESTMKYLEAVAVQMAKDIASGKVKIDRSKKGLVEKITATAMQWEFVKNMIFKKAKEQVMKASRGLYPAPLKVSIFLFKLLTVCFFKNVKWCDLC